MVNKICIHSIIIITVFYFISSFPFLLAFDVGGLGFEFCVFVVNDDDDDRPKPRT